MNKFNPLRAGQLSLVLKIAHAHCMRIACAKELFDWMGILEIPSKSFPIRKVLVLKIAHAHCMCEGAFRLDGNFRNPFQVFPNKKSTF